MSGHSKWATIKRKKGMIDAKRGKIFSKLAKEIAVASKIGGSDIHNNARLKLAIEKAKTYNLPKENIERALKKSQQMDSSHYEDYTYEGYGIAGIGILIEVLTDNKNRTGSEVRSTLTKSGGALAEPGAVSWNFERKGTILVKTFDEEALFEKTIDFQVDNINKQEEGLWVECALDDFEKIKLQIKQDFEIIDSDVSMIPKNVIHLTSQEQAQKIIKLLDKLEELDDVQKVFSNFDMDSSLFETILS